MVRGSSHSMAPTHTSTHGACRMPNQLWLRIQTYLKACQVHRDQGPLGLGCAGHLTREPWAVQAVTLAVEQRNAVQPAAGHIRASQPCMFALRQLLQILVSPVLPLCLALAAGARRRSCACDVQGLCALLLPIMAPTLPATLPLLLLSPPVLLFHHLSPEPLTSTLTCWAPAQRSATPAMPPGRCAWCAGRLV